MLPPSITTLSLFGIRKGHWRWGLAQMGTMPLRLQQTPGLQFFKLLGSGKGRVFSLTPDFYLYGLMAVWETEVQADDFFNHSDIMKAYQKHCNETWTVKLQPIKAHGLWDNQSPFVPAADTNIPAGPLAVLTRASINLRALPAFWKHGKETSKALENAPGLLAAVGLGELPFIRQATFSIWESEPQMMQYAYKNALHQQVIRKTRQDNWYHEELFARFRVISATGTWKGRNPLAII
ncbi:spheroidene monooxygenase [Adhaeribacter rhizoryzae]|uniref:Spheroidene monooxygenase n=1 Tax=Adhaeribacter rhizoryzae TaxID=2607907 RepID=A0A5M6DNU3_9BACT|nr:spheroidene monooxygenase [Adhaeribacter rhizoryzae]KAA5547912.1 spheroidene monooxygenase [Adhaeribacter rhizoryzae]